MFYELHGESVNGERFIVNESVIASVILPPSGVEGGCIVNLTDGGPPVRVTETYDELKVALGVKYVGPPNFVPRESVPVTTE